MSNVAGRVNGIGNRPRTPSTSSSLSGPGKDLVLGPGGALNKPIGAGNALGPLPGAQIAVAPSSSQAARKAERRERNNSQNGYVPLSAWKGPGSASPSLPPAGSASSTRQQPWPQLSSATLGAFANSKPVVTPPVMDTPISVDSYDRPSVEKEPVSFENNFPSLGNGGVTVKPAATGPKPASPVVAWGNADVASIVAATPAPAGVKSELSVEPTEEDEEAAEIARLKALIPKLNQPKSHGKGMAAIRERSKSVSAAKLGVPAQQPSRASTFSKGPVSTRPSILSKPNQLSSALSNPLIISNRPKLRSTMKASPRAGNAFPQASRAASAENSSAEQGKESLPSDIAEASSSETSRGSSTNGEDLSDCDTHQSSPGMHPEPTKTVTASAEPEAIFPLETGGEQVGEHRALSNPWSSGSTSPSPGTSDSDIAHRENRPRSSSRELSSNDSDRSGSHPLSVTAPPTLVEETGFASPAPFSASKVGRIFPRPAPYESTFQYSASLEKEEQFLRTLGWDRSAYYDSDVDENEFVITQEEKEEFFKGYARLVDSADGGPSGPGRDASDCFGMGIGGAQVDPWGLRQQPLHQTRRYDVPAQSRHVRLLDPSGDSSPVGSPIGTRYPAVAVDSPTLIRRFTAF